ncbi:MAG TPA: YkgJ family cysteine cluster protein [Blastocatellia bacterium]|nr:YkgJ family cysteine cluster protein [Blastocatellia bacterium]
MAKLRRTKEELSELCMRCGKCCMAMSFEGGAVTKDERDVIRWMELHGLQIDYYKKNGRLRYAFTIPLKCKELVEENGLYRCGIYETRPQMCRDYDGSIEGPAGVEDCLWKTEGYIETESSAEFNV